MNEFLTLNILLTPYLACMSKWFERLVVFALEVESVSLLACLVMLLLDRFGAPDDKANLNEWVKRKSSYDWMRVSAGERKEIMK